jgi:monoamine oxidase
MAGLTAARTLHDAGFEEVEILEGRDRVGGRVCTAYTADDQPVELGASFIHGHLDNPITLLAAKIVCMTFRSSMKYNSFFSL